MKRIILNKLVSEEKAIEILYNSKLYKYMENEKTKTWQYSTTLLYELLLEELDTGEINFPEI